MHKLATILLAAAAGFGLSQAASAADLGRAPVYKAAPPVATYTWTGSYVGLYVGGASSASDFTTSNPTDVAGVPLFGTGGQSSYGTGSSVIAGFTSGYNYQFAPNWLIGYEGETGYQKIDGGNFYPGSTTAFANTSSDGWYGSWSARLGYVVDRSLFYVKGGATLTRFHTVAYDTGIGVYGDRKKYVVGYAVGGGWEYMLDPKWSIKAEYLYLGYDSNMNFNTDIGADLPLSTRLSGIHTAKVGVNYKWDPLSLLFQR